MNSRSKSRLLTWVGVADLAVGLIWTAQGAGMLPGPMSGQQVWLYTGLAICAGGVVLLFFGLRTSRDPNGPPGQH